MNLTNSLSSDFFGDVAEGSVGEFLKNVPGVDVDYVGPDARGPRLRGPAAETARAFVRQADETLGAWKFAGCRSE